MSGSRVIRCKMFLKFCNSGMGRNGGRFVIAEWDGLGKIFHDCQLRVVGVVSVETGIAETGTVETDIAETGIAETGIAETGIAETDTAETNTAETGTVETNTTETDTVDHLGNHRMAGEENGSMGTRQKNKISARARFVKACIRAMASNQLFGTQVQTGKLQKRIVEPEWKCPDGYSLSRIDMRHFQMEWFAPAEVGNQVVLQLHGGGYINRLRNIYRDFAAKYSGMAGGMPVLSVDYRVAPEHPYPAALLDAITAYRWLLDLGYSGEEIMVAGDSAGGGLALALSMWLRDQEMSLPGKLVLMSPWADLTASGASYEENYHLDPMFGGSRESMIYLGVYPGEHDPMEPYISPMFGNFRGLPPMLIQAGSIEMLRSDAETVAGKAGQAGCRISLTVYPEMFHVFQMGLDLFPESEQAWQEVQEFIERN